MWTIKPQTIYLNSGFKVTFRPKRANGAGHHYVMDIQSGGETAFRVRFSAAGDSIRIEKLTPEAIGGSF